MYFFLVKILYRSLIDNEYQYQEKSFFYFIFLFWIFFGHYLHIYSIPWKKCLSRKFWKKTQKIIFFIFKVFPCIVLDSWYNKGVRQGEKNFQPQEEKMREANLEITAEICTELMDAARSQHEKKMFMLSDPAPLDDKKYRELSGRYEAYNHAVRIIMAHSYKNI